MLRKMLSLVVALCIICGCCAAFAESDKTVIQFFFPVQLGGAAANMIDQLVGEFEEANPDIDVDQVFCGNYGDTLTKLTLALESGEAPQLVILDQRLLSLVAMDAVMCLEDYIAGDGGDELMNDFYPGYLASGILDGKQYALPFQRSVIAMFYNKEHFKEAGLDPDKPPMTWDEYLEVGPKLTKKNEDGSVAHWGVGFATSGWIQQAMCIAASETNQKIFDETGTAVYFDTDSVQISSMTEDRDDVTFSAQFRMNYSERGRDALIAWYRDYSIMPEGIENLSYDVSTIQFKKDGDARYYRISQRVSYTSWGSEITGMHYTNTTPNWQEIPVGSVIDVEYYEAFLIVDGKLYKRVDAEKL